MDLAVVTIAYAFLVGFAIGFSVCSVFGGKEGRFRW